MSVYFPKPGTMEVRWAPGGWYVYDQHGLYDGPYESQSDAVAVIADVERSADRAFPKRK